MASVTICSDFGAQEEEIYHYLHLFPFYLPCINGTGCHDLSFLFSFKLAFSLSSFTVIKRLFSSSLLSAIRVVSSTYLRLLMLLLPVLILACNSSSLAVLMMCSASRLNKWVTADSPVVLLPQSWINQLFPHRVLTVALWPPYRFLRNVIQSPSSSNGLYWTTLLSASSNSIDKLLFGEQPEGGRNCRNKNLKKRDAN